MMNMNQRRAAARKYADSLPTPETLTLDAAWKQLYRVMTYLAKERWGDTTVDARIIIGRSIESIRTDMEAL